MSLIRAFKNNIFFRGCYMFLKSYFCIRKCLFGRICKTTIITPPVYFENSKNIFLGERTQIGPMSYISATNAKFIVKDNCSIAERLTVHTGNHARVLGKFTTDICEGNKPFGYDKDIVIENDVWVGCNVTLLSGVHIGRGATVAAGSVVVNNVPPYSVVGGVPSKVIKFYWTIDEIMNHESAIYSPEDRFTRKELENIFNGVR